LFKKPKRPVVTLVKKNQQTQLLASIPNCHNPLFEAGKKKRLLRFPYKENPNKRQCSLLILRLWKNNCFEL